MTPTTAVSLSAFCGEDQFLGMSAETGPFQAAHPVRKSVLNRAHRAKRGWPACGRMPFGRTFDRATGARGVDPDKQAFIEGMARRYLAGESLSDIAEEIGMNHSTQRPALTKRCGDRWVQTLRSADRNIDQTVTVTIPLRLPEEVVRAVRSRAAANNTYTHGQGEAPVLSGPDGVLWHCGYAMSGMDIASNRRRYYRRTYAETDRPCHAPRACVNADELEAVVVRHLFEMFGNPAAMVRAVAEATPDLAQVDQARRDLKRVDYDLEGANDARGRLVRMVARGTFSEADADAEMCKLGEREDLLRSESSGPRSALANVPDPASVKTLAAEMAQAFARRLADRHELMTWEDKRRSGRFPTRRRCRPNSTARSAT